MNATEIEELERLEKAATPGPWTWGKPGLDDAPLLGPKNETVIDTAWREGCGYYAVESVNDRALIAAARNALPALLAALRARDERIESLGRIVDSQAEDYGLWFTAQTAPEGYLQQELRKLHAAIEAARALLASGFPP